MSVGWDGEDRKQGDKREPVRNTRSNPGEQPGGASNPANKREQETNDDA